ncbi:MAG: ferrous iron transport protein B [Lachnospiraceae bacterium]
MSNLTIALLGQPNSGKSTLFNGLTGARQHVGNWPGKTVEKKAGSFQHNGNHYDIVDLPGAYSLSANSDEEIVTRDFIDDGSADLVCVIVDASQLERSMYMLADYAGIKTPVALLVNMLDLAEKKGINIDFKKLESILKIPVVPLVASNKKRYKEFYSMLEKKDFNCIDETHLDELYKEKLGEPYTKICNLLPDNLTQKASKSWLSAKLLEEDVLITAAVSKELKPEVQQFIKPKANLVTADCKFTWISELLDSCVTYSQQKKNLKLNKFDRIATHRIWGIPLAILVFFIAMWLSLIVAMPFTFLAIMVSTHLAPAVQTVLESIHVAPLVISLVCDVFFSALMFALAMLTVVLGTNFVFGFIEEIGYMARISYVFDHAMSKLGLQGKSIMPFIVSFGCNISGVSGARVIDSWGQRVATIAISWVVPCASSWAVVGLVAAAFFGGGATLVILALFLTAILHLFITSKIFGRSLIKDTDKTGLIMELPPYHRPQFKNIFRLVFGRVKDVLKRAFSIILCVSFIIWLLSYSASGNLEDSILYKVGITIEPFTMWFGLRWQAFMAWVSSGIAKEAALGVLSSLFIPSGETGGLWSIAMQARSGSMVAVDNNALTATMLNTLSKPEALAFVFAYFFNIPCLMTLGASLQESHSLKWTVRIALYYLAAALVLAMLAYHIGRLIF